MDRAPDRGARRRAGAARSEAPRRADDGDDHVYRAKDIAVMYRTNAQSRAIEEAFLRYGLRYQLVGGTRFYQRREVKDALAYLRALRSDMDWSASSGSSTCPGGASASKHHRGAARPGRPARWRRWGAITAPPRAAAGGLATRTRSALGTFATLISRLRTRVGLLPLPELLDAVLEESGYRASLTDGSQEGEDRWANLLELREVVDRYGDLEPIDALDRLLEETALVADQDAYAADADAATLITLHAAKGLEFDVVFIAGLEDGVFPHSRRSTTRARWRRSGGSPTSAMTRAKRPALPHARGAARHLGPRRVLRARRFLMEIPADLMHGPRLERAGDFDDDSARDPDMVFGRRTIALGRPSGPAGARWRGERPARGPASRRGIPTHAAIWRNARRLRFRGARSGSLAVPPGRMSGR